MARSFSQGSSANVFECVTPWLNLPAKGRLLGRPVAAWRVSVPPALARRLGEVMASLKAHGRSMLIAESNEVHVAYLLSRTYRIERGTVAPL